MHSKNIGNFPKLLRSFLVAVLAPSVLSDARGDLMIGDVTGVTSGSSLATILTYINGDPTDILTLSPGYCCGYDWAVSVASPNTLQLQKQTAATSFGTPGSVVLNFSGLNANLDNWTGIDSVAVSGVTDGPPVVTFLTPDTLSVDMVGSWAVGDSVSITLTAVPEPGGFLLGGLALISCVARRRRNGI